MEIYPAVDLYEEKVVRLERGDYQKCKVYSDSPEEVARRWADQGARWLHVVDLEGARSGKIKNWAALEKILAERRVSIQFGGGVRQPEDAKRLLDWGVKRIILGTKALDLDSLKKFVSLYGRNLAVSLDLRGDEIQVEGWLQGSGRSISEVFRELTPYAFQCVIVTDISRDGTLEGINLAKVKRLLEESPFSLILSGGVGSLNDIRSLASLRSSKLDGVIVGKALYEGQIDLPEAIRLGQVS